MYSRSQWREFFTSRPIQLLDRFGNLPGAILGELWTYVPGRRDNDNRALLVAHVDTVGKVEPRAKSIEFKAGRVSVRGGGILGADDRAGVAALWALRDMGHSLLLLDLEESGGIGAADAARILGADLSRHSYALEFDRFGADEIVFYPGTDSADFRQYLSAHLPRYRFGFGSYTDIATLCPVADIAGANISIGYEGHHTPRERLHLPDWRATVAAVRAMLAEPIGHHFRPDTPPASDYWGAAYRWRDPYESDASAPELVCYSCGFAPDDPLGAIDDCPDCGAQWAFIY